MDIIDIMLAKAMTPQGQTDTYVAKANRAAQVAAQAQADAEAAIASVTAAAANIESTQETIASMLEDAQEVLETAQQAQINIPELYSTTGQNTDGTMTQKAITDALATKADASALAAKADKTYVDAQIAAIPTTSGGTTVVSENLNLGSENAGHLVAIDNTGAPTPSTISEGALIDLMVANNKYTAENVVGLEINYERKTFTRVQEAANLSMGTPFNKYAMYGGRVRCNVNDNGEITAFYGDSNYRDDGSNGMVMVYQPKFYYKRIINSAEAQDYGYIVRHETLMLSPEVQSSFKLAPIFTGDLEYVLLPAYDASLVDNKLASIAGVHPVRNHTIEEMENYARARGNGWHIMNMAAESANQMLQIVEYGSMNGQSALEKGIVTLPSGIGSTCVFVTGSTAGLGNATGHAESTTMNYNGTDYTLTDAGQRAISYRGMENPWGNLWSMVGGVSILGDGHQNGGIPYICTTFNYSYGAINGDYEGIGFTLPNTSGWVNAMGYGLEKYDWVYMPTECSSSEASSLWPVGDGIWINANLNGISAIATGGSYNYDEECGPFYFATDRAASETSRPNYGAKLLYIPTKNEIYDANIAKWTTYIGG